MSTRHILIYPGEDDYFVVECPSLPGCVSQGKTPEEAIENIKEAIELYLEDLIESDEEIPEDNYESMVLVALPVSA